MAALKSVVFTILASLAGGTGHSAGSTPSEHHPLRTYSGPWGRIEAGFVPDATRIVLGEPVWIYLDVLPGTTGGVDWGKTQRQRPSLRDPSGTRRVPTSSAIAASGGDKALHSDLVGRLLKVMPEGWKVDSARLRVPHVQPMGRTRGLGSEMRLTHRSSPRASHPDALVVVWVMSKPSAPDPQSTHSPVDYLGEGRLGHVYLLAANVHDDPARHWIEYRGDIAVAMEAARRPRGTEAKVAWGGPTGGLQAGIRFKALVEKPTPRVLLVLHLRNAGTKPIRILQLLRRADYWGDHLPLEVKAGGKVLKYQGPELTPPPPPSVDDYADLGAGATESIEVTMKPELWGLADPRGAEIAFVFTNRSKKDIAYPYDDDTETWTEVTGLWTGTAHSGTITLDGLKPKRKGTSKG